MNCSQCGKEIPADSEFCGYCGATAVPAATVAASPPPPPPTPPGGPPPPAQPGSTPTTGSGFPPGQYGPPAKKSPLPWILGILGLLIIAAVVLVLVFVVFKGDDSGGVDEGPANTVEAFFASLEKQDARMLIGTMEPAFVEEIEDVLGEDYIDLLDEYFFTEFPEDLEVTIRDTETTIDGDTAEVLITEGTLSYTEDGERITEEAANADLDEFELVRVDGEWYLEEDFLIGMGFDFSGLEDYDYDELDFEDMDLEDLGYEDPRENDYYVEIVLPIDSGIEAFNVILEDTQLSDWYWGADLPQFDISDENTSYVVYLYEIDADLNEVPYGYYAVDKETGEIYEVVE